MLDIRRVERALSNRPLRVIGDLISIGYFLIIVLVPTIFVLSYALLRWDAIHRSVFTDPLIGDIRWQIVANSLVISFEIATLATLVDLVMGIPMAVLIARYEFRGKNILNTLIDLPLAVPTAALGFAVYLFWGTQMGISSLLGLEAGLVSPGPMMILLAHVSFTYPYVVRSLAAVIEEIDRTYEYAARTLGAPPFTVFRTITSPLGREGLIAGSILAFTRSLGETGATLIVSGVWEPASVVVVAWNNALLIPETAFMSAMLAGIGCLLLVLLKRGARGFRMPMRRIWPAPERLLSSRWLRRTRDTVSLLAFVCAILLPATYTLLHAAIWWEGSPYTGRREAGVLYQVFESPDDKWRTLLTSLITSMEVAAIATGLNLVFSVPMAMMIALRGKTLLTGLLDTLIDMPLMIPTSALGFSTFLFWGMELRAVFPGFWLVILTHVAFSYPYIVRPIIASLKGVDPTFIHVARTLGAKPATVTRTVILPMIKPGILAGAAMAFTRSLGETGATIMVMGTVRTAPVAIVNFAEALALQAGAFSCVITMVVAFCLLLLMRCMAGYAASR